MAAVLIPHHDVPRTHGSRAHGPGSPARLRLVEGGRSERSARYRRRRLVAGLLALALVGLVWTAASAAWDHAFGASAPLDVVVGPASSTGPSDAVPGATPAEAVHVVQPGDTLWSIAADLGATGDPRALVDDLAARAGGAELQVGQRIPVGGLVD